MKKFFKYAGIVLLWIIGLLVVFILWGEISSLYKYNHKYSIAMPQILGKYIIANDTIYIDGVLKSLKEETEGLGYSETTCDLKYNKCYENRVIIKKGFNNNYIFLYSDEFTIKFKDKNKIIFTDFIEGKIGEIDLNLKKLIYTNKPVNSTIQQAEVITDNQEIEKLEKQIISKYLKKKWFK